MNLRAAAAWAELANPSFYCGYQDAFTRGLKAAATIDRDERRKALGRALDVDPYPADTCPSGAKVPVTALAVEAVGACGLDGGNTGRNGDVGAATFLARRAVVLRLEAAGLYGADRKSVLDTFLLAGVLANDR